MKTKISLYFFSLLFLSFASCKKEEIKPSEKVNENHETDLRKGCFGKKECKINQYYLSGHKSKAWIIYQYVVGGIDLTASVPECSLDNIIFLTKKGDYIDTEGRTRCDSTLPDIHNQGIYKLLCDSNQISLTSPNLTTTFDVLELTSTSLKVEFFDPLINQKVQFWMKPAFGAKSR